MHVAVFVTRDFAGELGESDEAIPCWADLAGIPYEEMWPDNTLWLPELIAGVGGLGVLYDFWTLNDQIALINAEDKG